MTKKDILTKIKRTILGEDSTPGIANTKKVQKTDKKFNDDYYKDTDKKFKNYLGIKDDDFDAPKVNADEEQEKSYGGSGMEGLTYDNEGTEVSKKFVKRVDDLNKPSKDYYLKKDEVNDVYGKLKKKSSNYKKDKNIFQNTKPVRAIEAKTKVKNESTIKRLTYKTEFVNESVALNLIPEEFKQDNLIFEMTDGNKLMKIRWEGGKKGRATVLLSKDNKKINEELNRMHQLFEYNSRDAFNKSNLLTEEQELKGMVNKLKKKVDVESIDEVDDIKVTTPKVALQDESKIVLYNTKDSEWYFNAKGKSGDQFREAVIEVIKKLPDENKKREALSKFRNAMNKYRTKLNDPNSPVQKVHYDSTFDSINLQTVTH